MIRKHKFYDEKQQENAKKKYTKAWISILYSELAALARDIRCSRL